MKLKKYIIYSLFLSCLFSGFLGVAQTTEEDELDFLFGLSGEEITCDNITDVFIEYNNTIKLLTDVFSKSLSNMSVFMNDVHKKGQIKKSDWAAKKSQIKEAEIIMDENAYQILQKGEDIQSILQECLNP